MTMASTELVQSVMALTSLLQLTVSFPHIGQIEAFGKAVESLLRHNKLQLLHLTLGQTIGWGLNDSIISPSVLTQFHINTSVLQLNMQHALGGDFSCMDQLKPVVVRNVMRLLLIPQLENSLDKVLVSDLISIILSYWVGEKHSVDEQAVANQAASDIVRNFSAESSTPAELADRQRHAEEEREAQKRQAELVRTAVPAAPTL